MSALFSSVDMNNAPSCEVLPNKLTGTLTLEHAEIQGVNGNDQIRGEKWSQKECTGEPFQTQPMDSLSILLFPEKVARKGG
jgi:hypothetical protein